MKRRKKQNKTSCSTRCSAFIWRLAFRRMPILAVFAELSAEETAAQLRSWPVPGFWTGREQLAAQLPAQPAAKRRSVTLRRVEPTDRVTGRFYARGE